MTVASSWPITGLLIGDTRLDTALQRNNESLPTFSRSFVNCVSFGLLLNSQLIFQSFPQCFSKHRNSQTINNGVDERIIQTKHG